MSYVLSARALFYFHCSVLRQARDVARGNFILTYTDVSSFGVRAAGETRVSCYSTLDSIPFLAVDVAHKTVRDHRIPRMDLSIRSVMLLSAFLLFHSQLAESKSSSSLFSFIHDLIQYNIAGVPVIHEQTQWDFDPELGKQRRVRYEAENGHYGEYAIAKIGMGIGYKGPWGTVVGKGNNAR